MPLLCFQPSPELSGPQGHPHVPYPLPSPGSLVAHAGGQLCCLGSGLGTMVELWEELCVRKSCGKHSWDPPPALLWDPMEVNTPSPLLLVPVPSFVPCYSDPDLFLLVSCLSWSNLSHRWRLAWAAGWPWVPPPDSLLFLLGLSASVTLVGEGQPCLSCCHLRSHPSTPHWMLLVQNLSLRNFAVPSREI